MNNDIQYPRWIIVGFTGEGNYIEELRTGEYIGDVLDAAENMYFENSRIVDVVAYTFHERIPKR